MQRPLSTKGKKKQIKNETKNKTVEKSATKIKENTKNSDKDVEKIIKPSADKKLERSNSFILSNLTKLYNSVKGSKENINATNKTPSSPNPSTYRFSRSQTLTDIPIKNYRRSIRKSNLEELKEENDSDRIGQEDHQPATPIVAPTFKSYVNENIEELDETNSSGLLSKLKRTFSMSHEKRRGMSTKWSSIQSLQEIDNMVSYEDLRFINYDKFNTYEKKIERKVSQPEYIKVRQISQNDQAVIPPVVKLRVKKTKPIPFNSYINQNFDAGKNLFRQSLDSTKLEHFNNVNRDSFRLTHCYDVKDSLLLDSLNKLDDIETGDDFVKSNNSVVTSEVELRVKSVDFEIPLILPVSLFFLNLS